MFISADKSDESCALLSVFLDHLLDTDLTWLELNFWITSHCPTFRMLTSLSFLPFRWLTSFCLVGPSSLLRHGWVLDITLAYVFLAQMVSWLLLFRTRYRVRKAGNLWLGIFNLCYLKLFMEEFSKEYFFPASLPLFHLWSLLLVTQPFSRERFWCY